MKFVLLNAFKKKTTFLSAANIDQNIFVYKIYYFLEKKVNEIEKFFY